MTALALGLSPLDLVPGDPDGVDELASRLGTYSTGSLTAASRLRAIDVGTWVGEAGDAFRDALGELPDKLERGASSFGIAVSALRGYAIVLRDAQEAARRALMLYEDGQQQSRAWRRANETYEAEARAATDAGQPPPPGRPSSYDPGADDVAQAQRMLGEAQADVEREARNAVDRLAEAWESAPNEPGLFSKILHHTGQFAAGVWDGVYGLGEFAFKLSPTYALIDPDGYVEFISGLGQGIVYGVTHPVEFAKAITNWDMWLENPARAAGQLVPDLLLAVATAGGGTAATAGRRLASSADELSDMATAARRLENAGDAADASRAIDRLAVAANRNVDISRITPTPVWRTTDEPLFRLDNRPPSLVFKESFQPWDVDGEYDLVRYTQQGSDSPYVSTSVADDLYRRTEWEHLEYQYEIDAPGGIDVNATINLTDNLFEYEREITFPGGIDTSRIRGAWEMVDGPGGRTRGPWYPNQNYQPGPGG